MDELSNEYGSRWVKAPLDARDKRIAELEELLRRSKPFVDGPLADPIALGERESLLCAIDTYFAGKEPK